VATTSATRLAVLIDSDNTTASLTAELLAEIAKYGTPILSRQPEAPALPASDDGQPPPQSPDLKRLLSAAISSTSKDDGWSNLGEVGSYLSKNDAAFDPRDYGHTKLGELVRAEPYVDVKEVPGPTGLNQLWVRLTPKGRAQR
jgi:hypothetical protein